MVKRLFKKSIACLLAAIMIAASLPLTALADATTDAVIHQTITSKNNRVGIITKDPDGGGRVNGNDYNIAINSSTGNVADVTVNGVDYKVEIENEMPAVQAVPQAAAPAAKPAPTPVAAAPAPVVAKPAGEGRPVTSPLPGVIIEVSVKEGDTVAAGQKVAVLEAMKMENEIQSDRAGVVTKINVAKGDSVLEGAAIVTIA